MTFTRAHMSSLACLAMYRLSNLRESLRFENVGLRHSGRAKVTLLANDHLDHAYDQSLAVIKPISQTRAARAGGVARGWRRVLSPGHLGISY